MPPWRIEHLLCPNCGATIEVTLWTILDFDRDPGLRRRFLEGEINVAHCTACGLQRFVTAPLAVLDPDAGCAIFFIPDDPQINEQGMRQVTKELSSRLVAELEPPYPDYLFSPVIIRDPYDLVNRLAPESATRQTLPSAEAREVQPVLSDLPSHLQDTLRELMNNVSSLEEFESVLQAHPDLRAALDKVLAIEAESGFERVPSELDSLLHQLSQLARRSDMTRRVELCRQALSLADRSDNPSLWAKLQVELGNSLAQSPLGSRAENLEQAVEHYWQALEVYTRLAYPEHWATTQNNLANVYSERIRGERAENLERAIRHYQQALQVFTRQPYPEKWAMTQNNLANTYADRIQGERAENLEQAIHHYQQALKVYTHQAYPEQWAMTQNNLATAYSNRIQGERGENLEQAIHHYQQALEVRTREAYPEQWAMIQNNLANTYQYRIRGERAENLERAIHHFQQALKVYARQAYPEQWAMIQNNLASAYQNRIRGERAENLEQAIQHYQQALEVRTRHAYPEQWATTRNNLAITYRDRIRGERAENLERSIEHYQQALEVYTRQAYPEQWATTQNNLAVAYGDRIRGERGENLEQAIHHYRQALELHTRRAYPERWAGTQNNLAIAYSNRIQGERAENLEQAIQHFQRALEVYTRQAYPERWAGTQNNLANAYQNRIRGERSENLEQAIQHFQHALEVYTRQAYPEDWSQTQNNLAIAYQNRIRGERAENLEQAIHHYRQALKVYTHQAYPEKWAMTQNNLANTYADRIREERAENLERSIAHYQEALEVYTRQAYPEDWAMTQNNLGTAYAARIRGERGKNLERALRHYQQALEVRTRQAYPEQWAMTQNNLASAYQNRIRGERAENLEQAIHHYQQALEVRTREAYPEDWAMTQNNLASAYQNRIRGERAENLERSIEHYQQALEVYTRQAYPIEHQQTTRNLADLYFDDCHWPEAAGGYGVAIAAGDQLLAEAFTSTGRQAEVGRSARLYPNAAYALVQQKQIAEALNALEAGKTRLLRAALAIAHTAALPPPQRDRFEQARDRLLGAQADLSRRDIPTSYTEREGQLTAAREEFNALAEALGLISHPLRAEAIQAALPDDETAMIALLATEHGGLAFVVSRQSIRTVALPKLTTKRLSLLFTDTEEGPVESGWLMSYLEFERNVHRCDRVRLRANTSRAGSLTQAAFQQAKRLLEQTRSNWFTVVQRTLTAVGNLLWEPLAQSLESSGIRRLVLLPQGPLFLLPLHAAPFPDGRLALETYSIAYAPSATVWAEVQTHPRSALEAASLQVANPTGDLPYTLSEALAIAHVLGLSNAAILWEKQSTKAQLAESLPGKSLLHYSGHAAYNWRQPEGSALVLAGGDSLTLAEIEASQALAGNRLTVLSACETGLTETTRGLADEYIGLPAAFLEAGAGAVVASLWSVADISTSLLMICFYQHLTGRGASGPLPPSEALRGAQLWLRGASKAELLAQVDWLKELWREHNRHHPVGSPAYQRGYLGLLLYLPRARRFIENQPDDPPFAAPFWWAGFQAVGSVF